MPTGPAALAVKSGAVIVPVCTYVTLDSRVNVVFYPPIDLSSRGEENRDDVIAKTTQDLAYIFEDMISRDPTQWHVLHDEWDKS